jgi:cytochrome c-type biogenesis protein CcmH/NrfF
MELCFQTIIMSLGRFQGVDSFKIVHKMLIYSVLVGCILVLACTGSGTDAVNYEKRAIALDKSLMCPVCPGESLDQSQTQLAYQMKSVIRGKIKEGLSDREILNYFVERYGNSVLLEPQTEGVSLLVWVVPPVGVLFSLVVLVMVLRGKVGKGDNEDAMGQGLKEEPGVAVFLDEVGDRGWDPREFGQDEANSTRNEG